MTAFIIFLRDTLCALLETWVKELYRMTLLMDVKSSSCGRNLSVYHKEHTLLSIYIYVFYLV